MATKQRDADDVVAINIKSKQGIWRKKAIRIQH
jgi:hypothetical protein